MAAVVPMEQARQAESLLGRALLAEGRAMIACTLEPQHTRHQARKLARCTLWTREASGAQRIDHLAGKWFDDAAQAERSYAVLSMLWRNGFAKGEGLDIPRPRYLFREGGLLLLDWVPGTPLSKVQPGEVRHYRQAARWLRKVHAAKIPSLPPRASNERARFERARLVLEGEPSLAPLARLLIRAAAPALNVRPLCLVHGDYQPDNIIVQATTDEDKGGAGLTVIDFDNAASSHPAADVGHFVAQLWSMEHFRGRPIETADLFLEPFLAEYRQGMPPGLSDPPLAAFVANAALEIAAYVLTLSPEKRGEVESFLAHAHRATRTRFHSL